MEKCNKQTANTILMIEPVSFGFNNQTAINNYFQQKDSTSAMEIQTRALAEFKGMVDILSAKGIQIIVVQDTKVPHTPDSIFPNNWVTFHLDGRVALFPMFAENRRAERRSDVLDLLSEKGYGISQRLDYTSFEQQNRFLEGTGSMIFDHINNTAYAALSERTDKGLFLQFCKDLGFQPIPFRAKQSIDRKRLPIYHTNVMMSIGNRYAVVCLDTIDNAVERMMVVDSFVKNGKEIIEITENQMHCFAGNMLQVENTDGVHYLVMSKTAHDSLTQDQVKRLKSYNEIISISIPTIEKCGGGSVRCMMAEVFTKHMNTKQ